MNKINIKQNGIHISTNRQKPETVRNIEKYLLEHLIKNTLITVLGWCLHSTKTTMIAARCWPSPLLQLQKSQHSMNTPVTHLFITAIELWVQSRSFKQLNLYYTFVLCTLGILNAGSTRQYCPNLTVSFRSWHTFSGFEINYLYYMMWDTISC